MDIVEKLKHERDKRGWSNYKLARESNLPAATISHMFNRKTSPQLDTLTAICKGLGITLSEFFAQDETYSYLTDSQIEVINLWNCLTKEKQEAVKVMMKLLNKNDKL